jgi:hypothetical protein
MFQGSIDLGFQPVPLNVILAADSDFLATFIAQTGWPTGTQIQLRFINLATTTTWSATISDTTATFNVAAADVATLIGSQPQEVRLHYLDSSGDDLLWGKGMVEIV